MDKMGLQKRLNRQVRLAASQMIIGILFIIGIIIVSVHMFSTIMNFNGIGDLIDDLTGTIILLFILTWILLIVLLIIWIMGITNAVAVNKLTNSESTVLVIFSVFTFTIVHLIVAIVTRNKYKELTDQGFAPGNNAQLNKLKMAFENDVITAKEFELKKEELKKQENNK